LNFRIITLLFKQIRVIDVSDRGNHRRRRLKMKTFTIDGNNRILVFASKKEAAAASLTDTFTNQDELAELTGEWPMQRLVGIWNGLPGVTPVSKFTSRKIAVERMWKTIQGLEVSAKPEPAGPLPAESTREPEAVAADAQEAPSPREETAAEPQTVVEEPQAVAEAPQPAEPLAAVGAQVADVAPLAETPTQEPTRTKKARKASQKRKAEKQDSGPRGGTKTAQVVAMLQREGGATISEIMSAMGWQKHTVRGFMAGTMKKGGYTVESFKPEGGERTYRIQK
jgi:hypothetical protein